jgi:fructose-bisphosphate aldolase class II
MKLSEYLNKAYREHFAIGGFNFYNLESARAIVQAANLTQKPVLLMVSEKSIEYAGLDSILFIAEKLKKESKIPIFLHLDHGTHLDLIKECIKSGFDSVMFDGSKLPLDQNIALSAELRKIAHRHGVVFEAEIGRVGGQEDSIQARLFKSDPAEALMFYDRVRPDMLAVAIGNIHGERTAEEQLDFTLLAKIQDTVRAPLVLHGCSNRAEREYKVAISEGVVKINIDTELREAFVEGAKRALQERQTDPREILNTASSYISKRVEGKINIFSS